MEIIPKPKRELPHLEKIFFYLSILILLCSILFSFYFLIQEKVKEKKKTQIENRISALETKEIKEMREEVLRQQEKISQFSKLIKDYYFYSKIFPYLEKKIHQKVSFSKMELDFENSLISISGNSFSFSTLSQQLWVLNQDPGLKAELKEINLGKDGKVNFKIDITFDKKILK
jgi:preprotein translocase subunit SecF